MYRGDGGHQKVFYFEPPKAEAPSHARRMPEETALYKLVQDNVETFLAQVNERGRGLPSYVVDEFYSYLQCGILAHGFLRVKCEDCQHEKLVAFSCKRRGFCPSCCGRRMSETAAFLVDEVFPQVPIRQWVLSVPIPLRYWMAANPKLMTSVLSIITRAVSGFLKKRAKGNWRSKETGIVTLVQRFGGAVNLNIHFHMLVLDGVYITAPGGDPVFRELDPPNNQDIVDVVETIQKRVVRHLIKRGYLSDSGEVSDDQPELFSEEEQMRAEAMAASVQNKTAWGERSGEKVRRAGLFLGLPGEEAESVSQRCAESAGFSLHANVGIKAHERKRLEHLCRYVSRPPVANERLFVSSFDGQVCYRLKNKWRDGTEMVTFSPMEFMEKLVALIPQPRIHLVRYHGAFAPHSAVRSRVVPKLEQEGGDKLASDGNPETRRRRMTWAQLLKRVFNIEIEDCPCGGRLKVIAAIVERKVIVKILEHLRLPPEPPEVAPPRAPPQMELSPS